MDPRLFWESTFREIGLFLDGAQAAHRDEYNNAIVTAWHAAAFVWAKKLPKLSKVLAGEVAERNAPQTAEEAVNQWRSFFGKAPSNYAGH